MQKNQSTYLKKNNQNLTKLEVDECFSSPCQNGAKCHKLEQSGFSCDCRRGFTGEQYLWFVLPLFNLSEQTLF